MIDWETGLRLVAPSVARRRNAPKIISIGTQQRLSLVETLVAMINCRVHHSATPISTLDRLKGVLGSEHRFAMVTTFVDLLHHMIAWMVLLVHEHTSRGSLKEQKCEELHHF